MITSAIATAALPVVAHFGGWGAPWFALFIPLFWILLFVLVFGVFGRRWRRAAWASGRYGPHSGAASAETVLAERFARGDVDEVEYRARLEVLRASRDPRP
jgi:putative membrane protein